MNLKNGKMFYTRVGEGGDRWLLKCRSDDTLDKVSIDCATWWWRCWWPWRSGWPRDEGGGGGPSINESYDATLARSETESAWAIWWCRCWRRDDKEDEDGGLDCGGGGAIGWWWWVTRMTCPKCRSTIDDVLMRPTLLVSPTSMLLIGSSATAVRRGASSVEWSRLLLLLLLLPPLLTSDWSVEVALLALNLDVLGGFCRTGVVADWTCTSDRYWLSPDDDIESLIICCCCCCWVTLGGGGAFPRCCCCCCTGASLVSVITSNSLSCRTSSK